MATRSNSAGATMFNLSLNLASCEVTTAAEPVGPSVLPAVSKLALELEVWEIPEMSSVSGFQSWSFWIEFNQNK